MEINWWIIAVVAFCGMLLIGYLLKQNSKDKKNLEKRLNDDYKRQRENELNDES